MCSSDQAGRRSALAALAEELAGATAALREREDELEALRAVSLRGEAALQACMARLQARTLHSLSSPQQAHAVGMQPYLRSCMRRLVSGEELAGRLHAGTESSYLYTSSCHSSLVV
jgi:hypothetical protein